MSITCHRVIIYFQSHGAAPSCVTSSGSVYSDSGVTIHVTLRYSEIHRHAVGRQRGYAFVMLAVYIALDRLGAHPVALFIAA